MSAVQSENKVVIMGVGQSGSIVTSLIRQSNAEAHIIAVDDNKDILGSADADVKILIKDGKFEPEPELDAFKLIFIIADPSEGSSLTYSQAIASKMSDKSFVYGIMIKPQRGWTEKDRDVYSSFDGAAVVDVGWVFEKRGKSDVEDAMRISFNFIAHTLAFISAAITSGDLSLDAFRNILAGKVASFAATSVSQPATLYILTMSDMNRSMVSSGLIFMPEDTEDIIARRLFLGVAGTLPPASDLATFRIKGVEPFRILAILARPY
ncbi:hypothetical protein CUJ83_11790 [Methanocella sp. CWC-04]|uniref:Uncharacterized protein n=1 Tax=Methanooceanicella nereidis TaxID=2052831 RepID=A0AAP2W7X1_9EURY|nr:hypothetical protein [Methanocella sp. CWC-04]MCD1295679.1 hypothetical protein [Methanocella sp. CWC-04]